MNAADFCRVIEKARRDTVAYHRSNLLITSVHCAICRQFVTTGQYTIAPAESVHAGKPVCASCIDLAPASRQAGAGLGPSERKALRAFWDNEEDAAYDDPPPDIHTKGEHDAWQEQKAGRDPDCEWHDS